MDLIDIIAYIMGKLTNFIALTFTIDLGGITLGLYLFGFLAFGILIAFIIRLIGPPRIETTTDTYGNRTRTEIRRTGWRGRNIERNRNKLD